MFLINLFRRERKITKLLSSRDLQQAIEHERMRVDRNHSSFALIVFDCGGKPCVHRISRLAEALDAELRMTDRPGFLDRFQVAVLLPDTDAAGGIRLRDRLSETFDEDGKGWQSQVLAYPQDELPCRGDEAAEVIESTNALFVRRLPLWKRALDVLGVLLALTVAAPLMLLAAIAIKVTSPGPILFRQTRAGLGGRPFTIYKFRTMLDGAEELKASLLAHSEQDGPAFKIKNDPRVTRVGRYLRKTCIDEFPQFWNVLRGDMSLVGPRPLPVDEAEKCERWQRRRMIITPGLTCTWQVSGGMCIPFIEWMRMDIRYAHSQQLIGDLVLLWRTFWVVLFHRASHYP